MQHQPAGVALRSVQQPPRRAEHPLGRRPAWLLQPVVPAVSILDVIQCGFLMLLRGQVRQSRNEMTAQTEHAPAQDVRGCGKADDLRHRQGPAHEGHLQSTVSLRTFSLVDQSEGCHLNGGTGEQKP